MKYTKEQLQEMSDLEVNRALAMAMHKYAGIVGDWMPNGVKVNDDSGFFYSECDYCNNWNDVMPLAVEHKVALTPHYGITDTWVAQYYFDAVGVNSVINDNPQRAITCCLILVLQDKQ